LDLLDPRLNLLDLLRLELRLDLLDLLRDLL
jgi:hypothetical protein